MTDTSGVNEEEMQNLMNIISHLENRVEKFKRLSMILEDLWVRERTKVVLDAPPDQSYVWVRVEEPEEPSSETLELLELQDGSNKIEYIPDGNRYRIKIRIEI